MKTKHSVNPARRLHTFLDAFRTHDHHGHKAGVVIAALIGTDDIRLLQREIWRASQLPSKAIRATINAVGPQAAREICRWEEPLRGFFGTLSLNAQVQKLLPYLDENTMYSVSTCAAFLAREEGRTEVQDLLDDIDEIRDKVEGLDLPEDLRSFVEERLRDIEMAVGDYCHGVDDSSEMVEVCWRTRQKIQEMAAEKRPTKAMKNGLAVLGRLVVVLNAAAGLWEKTEPMLQALAQNATKQLPPGPT